MEHEKINHIASDITGFHSYFCSILHSLTLNRCLTTTLARSYTHTCMHACTHTGALKLQDYTRTMLWSDFAHYKSVSNETPMASPIFGRAAITLGIGPHL